MNGPGLLIFFLGCTGQIRRLTLSTLSLCRVLSLMWAWPYVGVFWVWLRYHEFVFRKVDNYDLVTTRICEIEFPQILVYLSLVCCGTEVRTYPFFPSDFDLLTCGLP